MTATIAEVSATSAARGAAYLDNRRPGWHNEIDVDNLDLRSLDACVLGQLYGDWGAGQDALEEFRWNGEAQIEYGFEVAAPHSTPRYAALTEAWRVEILRRREGDG